MNPQPVAIVTGAAQGIGRAIATRLAQDGFKLAVIDLNQEALSRFAPEINGAAFTFDLQNTAGIPDLVAEIETQLGPIQALVNSAGICPTRPFFAVKEESFRKVLEINVLGLFFMMQAVAERMMVRQTGSIVNLASVSAFLPKLEQLDYGASKAAVVSMTRSAAVSLGPHQIRVNAIAPGVIDTPLTWSIANQRAEIRGVPPEETLNPVIKSLPLGKIGSPEDVAELAAFLLSERAKYITGQTIDVCGGQLMR